MFFLNLLFADVVRDSSVIFSILTTVCISFQEGEVTSELSYDHVSQFVQSNEVLQFLHDILPPKVTYAEALELMKTTELDFSGSEDEASPTANKKAKARAKNSGNSASNKSAKSSKAPKTSNEKEKSSKKTSKSKESKSKAKEKPVTKSSEVKVEIKEEPEVDVHFEDDESNHVVSSSFVEFEVEETGGDNNDISDDSNSMEGVERSNHHPSTPAQIKKESSDHDYFS